MIVERIKRFSEDYYRVIALECEAMLFASVPENSEIAEPHIFSERFNARMEEIFRMLDKPERKISKKVKIIIAVAAAVIMMLFTALSVGAVRDSLYRLFFLERNPAYAVFQYRLTEDDIRTAPDIIETVYRPAYIPEGYIQTEELILDKHHSIQYSKGVVSFEFRQVTLDSVSAVSLENVEAETVRINGCDVLIITDRTYISAHWCNDEYKFTVIGVISREDAEKVIKSVGKS